MQENSKAFILQHDTNRIKYKEPKTAVAPACYCCCCIGGSEKDILTSESDVTQVTMATKNSSDYTHLLPNIC